MFRKFGASWKLVKMSYGVLKQDKELMIFPIASFIAMIAVSIALMLPMGALGVFDFINGVTEEMSASQQVVTAVLAFIYYFIFYFIMIYANTALIGAAMIRMDGGDPTVQDGLNVANSRLGVITGWAAIAATVGLILNTLQNMAEDNDNAIMAIIGSIIVSMIGFAWNLITFLVIPVFVVENVGPIQAIKRSGSLLKQTWGENLTGGFSMGLIQFLVILLVLIVVGLPILLIVSMTGSGVLGVVGILVVFLAIMAVSFFFSALNSVFQAALYKYATAPNHAVQSPYFDERLLADAFQHKQARARR